MSQKDKSTQDNAVNNTDEETVETPEEETQDETPEEETAEETIGDALRGSDEEEEEDDSKNSVPLAKFLDEKKERKELQRQLDALQAKATEDQLSKKEITGDLKALAAEHNIDPGFLEKLASGIRAQAEVDLDERIQSELRPLKERDRRDKIEAAFQKGFKQAMDNMPEYEGVVNPSVIKTLSLDPKNAKKTFRALIEETYGNALGGKRTIETSTPRGGNTSGKLDIAKAQKDPAYFREVMADPDLKAEYNSQLAERALS